MHPTVKRQICFQLQVLCRRILQYQAWPGHTVVILSSIIFKYMLRRLPANKTSQAAQVHCISLCFSKLLVLVDSHCEANVNSANTR